MISIPEMEFPYVYKSILTSAIVAFFLIALPLLYMIKDLIKWFRNKN